MSSSNSHHGLTLIPGISVSYLNMKKKPYDDYNNYDDSIQYNGKQYSTMVNNTVVPINAYYGFLLQCATYSKFSLLL